MKAFKGNTTPTVDRAFLQAVELAKQDVAQGYSLSYSTEPGKVWLQSDQGWFKVYDDNKQEHYLGSNDTLSDY